ncbi:MAG: hypothetical protein CVU14_03890 [Bacteroidetes bacterium HGW-Bacteroidetes-9]|jgi:hypothetical protein|nr:MAG: hypothetical protein CVU14_03890 [Bacteroidetes bacterium HGW-Bacteroidetes-9]
MRELTQVTQFIEHFRGRKACTESFRDRPNVFYFWPTTHFLKTILASRTNDTTCPDFAGFAFAPKHEANPSAKSKELFLSTR